MPELSVVLLGTRYLLTLLPKYFPPQDAPEQTPSGWGWVDGRLEGLAAAMRRHNVNQAGCNIWRRADGVMVCASNAATRRKLMTLVNQTAAVGTAYYRTEQRHFDGAPETWIYSLPAKSMTVERVPAAQPGGPSPSAPRPLTVYGGSLKRSIAVCLQPNSTARSITPPPEGPRKRLQRIAAAETALRNMGEAILQLQQETLTLREALQDLRSLG